jgi:hypothetical protein
MKNVYEEKEILLIHFITYVVKEEKSTWNHTILLLSHCWIY